MKQHCQNAHQNAHQKNHYILDPYQAITNPTVLTCRHPWLRLSHVGPLIHRSLWHAWSTWYHVLLLQPGSSLFLQLLLNLIDLLSQQVIILCLWGEEYDPGQGRRHVKIRQQVTLSKARKSSFHMHIPAQKGASFPSAGLPGRLVGKHRRCSGYFWQPSGHHTKFFIQHVSGTAQQAPPQIPAQLQPAGSQIQASSPGTLLFTPLPLQALPGGIRETQLDDRGQHLTLLFADSYISPSTFRAYATRFSIRRSFNAAGSGVGNMAWTLKKKHASYQDVSKPGPQRQPQVMGTQSSKQIFEGLRHCCCPHVMLLVR